MSFDAYPAARRWRDHASPDTHAAVVSEIGMRWALRDYTYWLFRKGMENLASWPVARVVEHLADPLWAPERAAGAHPRVARVRCEPGR